MAEWVSRPSSSGGLSVAPTSVSVRRGSVLGAAKPLRPASEANLELDAIRISSSRGAISSSALQIQLDREQTQRGEIAEAAPPPGRTRAFNPDTPLRVAWDWFVMSLVLVNVITVPFIVAFSKTVRFDGMFVFDGVVDVIFAIDIYMNFTTGYWNKDDLLVMELSAIGRRYLKGFFTIDVISVLPIDYILVGVYGFSHSVRYARFTKMTRLLRLFRLFRLMRYFKRYEAFVNLPWIQLRIIKTSFFTLLITHWHACLYYLVATFNGSDALDWVVVNGLTDASPTTLYSYSFLASSSMLVGNGLGSYASGGPAVRSEQWTTVYIALCGTLVWSVLKGFVSVLVVEADAVANEHTVKMAYLTKYFVTHRDTPAALRSKMRKYFLEKFKHGVYDESDMFKDMPLCIRQQIAMYNANAVVEAVPLLRYAAVHHEGFVLALALELSHVMLLADEVIFEQGQLTKRMFFLQSGSVEFSAGGALLGSTGPGSFIGEVPMIWKVTHPVAVRTAEVCHMHRLKRDAFIRLFPLYPEVYEGVRTVALRRLKEWGMTSWIRSWRMNQVYPMTSDLLHISQLHDDVVHMIEAKRSSTLNIGTSTSGFS